MDTKPGRRSPYTARGKWFLAGGWAGLVAGSVLGNPPLISVGVLLICLPNFAYLAAMRSRFRLNCTRSIVPGRVRAGEAAWVLLRLRNGKPVPTSLLLAEDQIPYSLGDRQRFVLNGIERGGCRDLRYQVRSDHRGRFTIGPLRVRITDVFGLVELTAGFPNTGALTVTPRVMPLTEAATTGAWSSEGTSRARMAAAAGDDDVIPRPYAQGDELRRVHWRSTARYGELMVRREEQHWQNRAVLLLDTRESSHDGTGPGSSFEYAVSAAASIGVHLARSGISARLVTDAGPLVTGAAFEDLLLDTLAVIGPSQNRVLDLSSATLGELRGSSVILAAGRLSASEAAQLAAAVQGRPGIAVLLAVSTWAGQPVPADGPAADPAIAAARGVLLAAGWRVTCAGAATPLTAAWQLLAAGARTGAG